MKAIKATVIIIGLVFIGFACNSPDMSKTWTADQEMKWKENCMKFMTDRDVKENQAEDFCDCMFDKTSHKYSPEEAAKITEEEERKLWQECDYQW